MVCWILWRSRYGSDRHWKGIRSFLEKDMVESNKKPRFLAEGFGKIGCAVGKERELWLFLDA